MILANIAFRTDLLLKATAIPVAAGKTCRPVLAKRRRFVTGSFSKEAIGGVSNKRGPNGEIILIKTINITTQSKLLKLELLPYQPSYSLCGVEE